MKKKTNTNTFDTMKQLFPVTKTLAFRLVPVGATRPNLDDVIEDGRDLERKYEILKVAADRVHKDFIESTLSGFRLKYVPDGNNDSVFEYADIFYDKALSAKDKEPLLEEIAVNLRKQVGDAFAVRPFDSQDTMLRALASRKLVKDILVTAKLSQEEEAARMDMERFTSYMRPYFETRDRMYDPRQKGNTIPVRIVDDNLPIHLANVAKFAALPDSIIDALGDEQFYKDFIKSNMDALTPHDVFTVSYGALLSSQAAIDAYNTIIGGVSEDHQTRVKGLNERIKEYNDHLKKDDHKLPLLKKLKKQILSDRITVSWRSRAFDDDAEVLEAMKVIREELTSMYGGLERDLRNIPDKEITYIGAKALQSYSRSIYGSRGLAEEAVKELLRQRNPKSARMSENGYAEKINKMFKRLKDIPVANIEEGAKIAGIEPVMTLEDYITTNIKENLTVALANYAALDEAREAAPDEPLGQSADSGKQGAGRLVKEILDGINDAIRAAKAFSDGDGSLYTDTTFYDGVVNPLKEFTELFTPAYNSIRNYLTRKPYSTDKVRLSFWTPSLLSGWDIVKIRDARSVILREGDDLYLGILSPKGKALFDGNAHLDNSSPMTMMQAKGLRDAFMTLPKVAFAASNAGLYNPPAAVLKLRDSGKAVAEYTPAEVAMMVDFYKHVAAVNPAWKILGFKFKDTSAYKRLNDFFVDFDRQSYKNYYVGVSKEYIYNAVSAGDLYLFRITCQDMLKAHHGKDGDYKILLQQALSASPDSLVRLQGGATIYFREASLEKKVTHPANVPIAMKNPINTGRTRTLPYDLYKDRRYMEDRFAFHVPVIINPNADAYGEKSVNRKVQEMVKANPDMYVLGINRGERNLISIAVTDPFGNIVEQRNLNVFDNYDYQEALAVRERERRADRQDWNAVKKIKDLKTGYISRAVGEVVRMVKKYNCIVAMERLDTDFRYSRRAFERGVYEQFERAVIGKLGLLMDKDSADRVAGALQLSTPGKNVAERTKFPQSGIVFLMNPSWITMTDPYTGFVNRLDTRFISIEKAEEFIDRLDAFRHDAAKDRFVMTFTYAKAAPQKKSYDAQRVWNVETYGERIENTNDIPENPKGALNSKAIDLTEAFKALFDAHGIVWETGDDILPQMKGQNTKFWKEFFRLLRLTLKNTSWDAAAREFRVVGCTAKDGRFYDSRWAPAGMPLDADVNAAWNLARKAHMAMKRIRDNKDDKTVSIVIRDEEWFKAVQL